MSRVRKDILATIARKGDRGLAESVFAMSGSRSRVIGDKRATNCADCAYEGESVNKPIASPESNCLTTPENPANMRVKNGGGRSGGPATSVAAQGDRRNE